MTKQLKNLIRQVPDFPKKGINFLDITPLISSGDALQVLISQMGAMIEWSSVDVIIGIESRGFILGAALAAKHNKGFVPCRKAGKLPPPVHSESYSLEYGMATLEMQPGQGRALIVDDVLATGGTLKATINIAEKSGFRVSDLLVLIDIPVLNSMKFKGEKIKSLFQY